MRRCDDVLVLSVLFSRWLVLFGQLRLLFLAATTKRSHFAPTTLICVLVMGNSHFGSSLPGHQIEVNQHHHHSLHRFGGIGLVSRPKSHSQPINIHKNTTSIQHDTSIDNLVAVDRFLLVFFFSFFYWSARALPSFVLWRRIVTFIRFVRHLIPSQCLRILYSNGLSAKISRGRKTGRPNNNSFGLRCPPMTKPIPTPLPSPTRAMGRVDGRRRTKGAKHLALPVHLTHPRRKGSRLETSRSSLP